MPYFSVVTTGGNLTQTDSIYIMTSTGKALGTIATQRQKN